MSNELATLNESRDLFASREESVVSPDRSAREVPEHRPGTNGDVRVDVLQQCNGRQPEDQPPRIGAYLVLALSGSDAQAQIFRVLHRELRKEFVLKLYRDGATHSPAVRERVRQEGRVVAECRHPNLLEIVDVDLNEGHLFVVTERVQGLSLTDYVRQRRPGAREAAGLVVELARAVDYLHARGIIHQGLTHSNVLIDETGRPKLMDFGLSRLRAACFVDSVGPDGSATPKPNHRNVTGQAEPVGPATDVFGLGIVLKHVLIWDAAESNPIGATLFQRDNEKADLRFRTVPPRIPLTLQRICKKAMAPDQNRRYQSAAALGRALRSYRARRWLVWTASVILAAMAAQFIARH